MIKKNVLIWGFYDQRNLGDDLMGVIFYNMLKDIKFRDQVTHVTPYIYSKNPDFEQEGCSVCSNLSEVNLDSVIFGGGAFLKAKLRKNKLIEAELKNIYNYIQKAKIPAYFASIGSDGFKKVEKFSINRLNIIKSQTVAKIAVRTLEDQNILKKEYNIDSLYIEDILFATAYFAKTLSISTGYPLQKKSNDIFISITKRHIFWGILIILFNILPSQYKYLKNYFAHRKFILKKKFFRSGGEVRMPFLKQIDPVNIAESLDFLRHSKLIITSKLHPGVINLSFGNDAWFVNPTSKISNCIRNAEEKGLVKVVYSSKRLIKVSPTLCKDFSWQRDLANSYIAIFQNI